MDRDGSIIVFSDFMESVDELMASSFVRSLQEEPTGLTLFFQQGEPLRFSWKEPHKEHIRSMLLVWRMIYQERDEISLPRMGRRIKSLGESGLLSTSVTERQTEAWEAMEQAKKRPAFASQQIGRVVTADGLVLEPANPSEDRVVEIVLYGELAHHTEDKRNIVRILKENPTMWGLYRNSFLKTVMNNILTLNEVGKHIVVPALGELRSR